MQIQLPGGLADASQTVGGYLPNLLGAAALLVVGWLTALFLSAMARRLVRGTGLLGRVAALSGDDPSEHPDFGELVGRGVFLLVMLFVAVGMFQVLDLSLISEPLNAFLGEISAFAPRILGAVFLLGVAWLIATILRRLVHVGIGTLHLEERMSSLDRTEVPEKGTGKALAESMGDAVYWLTLLLFLPAILGTLAIDGLLGPVQRVADQILGYLPNLFGASVLFVVGWYVAKLVRSVIRNTLEALGADEVGARLGLATSTGGISLSRVVGIAAYTLILIPVTIASLNALEMDAVTAPASRMLGQILSAIPSVFAAALLLGIAYLVGRLVGGMAASLLDDSDLDRLAGSMGVRPPAADLDRAAMIRSLVVTVIMLFASIEAASLMGFAGLSVLLTDFAIFAGEALVGVVIFGVGLYLANLAERTIRSSQPAGTPYLALAAKASIIVLATAMALGQMGVAGDILNLAFGLLLGSIAVAVALAFGLGSRDIAAEQVRKWLGNADGQGD